MPASPVMTVSGEPQVVVARQLVVHGPMLKASSSSCSWGCALSQVRSRSTSSTTDPANACHRLAAPDEQRQQTCHGIDDDQESGTPDPAASSAQQALFLLRRRRQAAPASCRDSRGGRAHSAAGRVRTPVSKLLAGLAAQRAQRPRRIGRLTKVPRRHAGTACPRCLSCPTQLRPRSEFAGCARGLPGAATPGPPRSL
jgi:hypothetical protein